MRAGLEAFARQAVTSDFAVHHCAVAVEHALKAYLASLLPALIVEGRDLDSLLHATGHANHAAVPVTRIKTIGLAEAYARAERLLRPQITVGGKTRDQVLAARNGVAHSGLHDVTEVETVLVACIRIADGILAAIGVPAQDYWGPYGDLRDRLSDEHANAVRVRYEITLTRARDVYRSRFDGMTPEAVVPIIAALTARQYDQNVRSERTCPACGEKGLLFGTTSADGAEVGRAASRMVSFHSDSFSCVVCGLALRGVEELEIAELPVRIPLYPASDDEDNNPRESYDVDFMLQEEYGRKPAEYDDYEPEHYEAEDNPNDPDFRNYDEDETF